MASEASSTNRIFSMPKEFSCNLNTRPSTFDLVATTSGGASARGADWRSPPASTSAVKVNALPLPGALLTVGGFHGLKGQGGPRDGSTGYIAPLHTEVLDHDIVYEAAATLVVGDLEEIRAYAKSQRPASQPSFDFEKDRAHCVPFRLRDEAPPYEGAWRLTLDQDDPHIVTAPVHFEAKRVKKLYLRAAYRTKGREGELFFAPPGGAVAASEAPIRK